MAVNCTETRTPNGAYLITISGRADMLDDIRDFRRDITNKIKASGVCERDGMHRRGTPTHIVIDLCGIESFGPQLLTELAGLNRLTRNYNAKLALVASEGSDLEKTLKNPSCGLKDVTAASVDIAEQMLQGNMVAGVS